MSDLNLFHGPNAGYAQELYERYQEDPNAVDASTRAFFNVYARSLTPQARNGHDTAEGNGKRKEGKEDSLSPQPSPLRLLTPRNSRGRRRQQRGCPV